MLFKKNIRLFLLLIISLISNQLFAQISFGVRGGGGVAQGYLKYPIGQSTDQEFVIGKTGGVFFKYLPEPPAKTKIGLTAGVIIEVNFTQKGWKEVSKTILFDDAVDAEIVSHKKMINYIELPFLSHFSIGRKKTRFIINMGPQMAYSLGSTEVIVKDNISIESSWYSFPSTTDKRFEFAITGGLGFAYDSSIGTFHLETRFSQSLTDMKDIAESEQVTWAKSQFFNITLGFAINL